jgi:RNA polymerase sigma-70 factor, ECF subfamily
MSTKVHGQLSQSTDEELAARAQSGAMPAFVELVSRFEGRIYNFILRRVRLASDAEDLTQETFLRAWQHVARFQPRHRFSTWLFRIASNLAIDHLRTRAHRQQKSADLRQHAEASYSQEPDAHQLTDDGAALWNLAASVLSDEQHAALWLRYAEDLEIREIAAVLGRTQISVRVMLMRARNLLAQRAAQKLGSDGEARANRQAQQIEPPPSQGGLSWSCR